MEEDKKQEDANRSQSVEKESLAILNAKNQLKEISDKYQLIGKELIQSSNKKFDDFSGLMIQTAVAIGGLSATHILSEKPDVKYLLHSRWAIVFLGISIVMAGIQMNIDAKFFKKGGTLFLKYSSVVNSLQWNPLDPETKKKQKDLSDALLENPECSNTTVFYLQIIFVILGVVFSLIDVFY